MKKLVYTLFAIALVAFMLLPQLLEDVSFDLAILSIGGGFAVLLGMTKLVNRVSDEHKESI